MYSNLISRLTMATLLAAGLSMVPVTMSSSGQLEEAKACAGGLACKFEPGSICEASGEFDFYESGDQDVLD